jgi:hypothetical protein
VASQDKCFEIFDTATGRTPHSFAAEARDPSDTMGRLFKRMAALLNSPTGADSDDRESGFDDRERRNMTLNELDKEATDFLLGIRMFANETDGPIDTPPDQSSARAPVSVASTEDVYEVVLPHALSPRGAVSHGDYDNLAHGDYDSSDDDTVFESIASGGAESVDGQYGAIEQQRVLSALSTTRAELESQRRQTTELLALVSGLRRSLKRSQVCAAGPSVICLPISLSTKPPFFSCSSP